MHSSAQFAPVCPRPGAAVVQSSARGRPGCCGYQGGPGGPFPPRLHPGDTGGMGCSWGQPQPRQPRAHRGVGSSSSNHGSQILGKRRRRRRRKAKLPSAQRGRHGTTPRAVTAVPPGRGRLRGAGWVHPRVPGQELGEAGGALGCCPRMRGSWGASQHIATSRGAAPPWGAKSHGRARGLLHAALPSPPWREDGSGPSPPPDPAHPAPTVPRDTDPGAPRGGQAAPGAAASGRSDHAGAA